MKLTAWTFLLCLFGYSLSAQSEFDASKKEVSAHRISEQITIDGVLDETAWLAAPFATNLVQLEPNPGEAASQKTHVKVLYDNTGMYIGAMLHDTNPDSILQQLSQRDEFGNTDWFGVFIDAYRDGINGVSFIVTPSEVQFDAKYSAFGEDSNWDAVWESKTRITSEGWVAEMKIPYAAIRFPDTQEQTWHINFGRLIGRGKEKSFWNQIDPQVNGFLNQSGYLKGIEDVKSPVRLQATPFLAVYGEHHHDASADPSESYGRSFNGGMDIKYGISDAFTLDMTLIPDFGEARSDNQVLNLSPFEVRFNENRQFFTEGIELFNKGGLFYSRRLGGQPLHLYDVEDQLSETEELVDNPSEVQLYNATKISGRTSKGLGIGFFNATAGETYATIRDTELGTERRVQTNPLTNYNVLVFDQNLKNNSYVTFINTTVLRNGNDYDANVTGTVFELRNKANSYQLSGRAILSQKYFTDNTDLGHSYNLNLRKTSGNFNWGTNFNVESDTYDINDMGFLFNNNERSINGFMEYNFFKPFWKFNRAGIGMWTGYSQLYKPAVYTDYGVEVWSYAQTKGFWDLNVWAFFQPFPTHDYFEPRVEGKYLKRPTKNSVGFWMRSDSRKRFFVSMNANIHNHGEPGRTRYNYSITPTLRINDKLQFSYSIWNGLYYNEIGFVDFLTNEETQTDEPIMGRRDQVLVENNFNAAYSFNANMALTFRLRHYWTKVEYDAYHSLKSDGTLGTTDYDLNNNTSFNAFNIDMIYRWRFAPGSDIFIIWKNSIFGFEEELDQRYLSGVNYMDNLNGLFNSPQTNSLSFKIIYFLDYASIMSKRASRARG